jgi:hypothetical protein
VRILPRLFTGCQSQTRDVSPNTDNASGQKAECLKVHSIAGRASGTCVMDAGLADLSEKSMASCMICNVEFDPSVGTSKNFCPQHCAPVTGRPAIAIAKGPTEAQAGMLILATLGLPVAFIALFVAGYFGWVAIIFLVGVVFAAVVSQKGRSTWTPTSSAMICPHCQMKGFVSAVPTRRKVGVSGGKATAALLTGGLSLFATGLSRKESVTEAHCSHCGAHWVY